jgi:hypothetical protein
MLVKIFSPLALSCFSLSLSRPSFAYFIHIPVPFSLFGERKLSIIKQQAFILVND